MRAGRCDEESADDAQPQAEAAMPIYGFSARLSTGEERHLADYRGKALLIVNVASKCGFTPQYKGLQGLYEQFRPRGFEILAFPCDQFGHQEPGTDADISAFCDRTYAVTFPLFAKIEVNGENAHPLYLWLKNQRSGLLGSSIKWNFTKFLVDKTGAVRARFAPMTRPEKLAGDVAALL
jgi:glutathione peroxidase